MIKDIISFFNSYIIFLTKNEIKTFEVSRIRNNYFETSNLINNDYIDSITMTIPTFLTERILKANNIIINFYDYNIKIKKEQILNLEVSYSDIEYSKINFKFYLH